MSRVYSQKKIDYSNRLADYFAEYTGILLVQADNVGSFQLQQIRALLRGKAVIAMGKNTQMRRVLRQVSNDYPDLAKLLPHIVGNVGLVFTNGDLKEVRDTLISNRVPAAAKPGITAPDDVFVPPGPTGCDPGQTAFFQAVGVPTKIARGAIEIVSTVHLITKGDRVGSSEVALLSKLNIKPFTYGLNVSQIYDTGDMYSAAVLDMTDDELLSRFFTGVTKLAAVGLELGYPMLPTLPHSFASAFKKLLAIAVETDYDFEQAKEIKQFLADPSAFAVAAAPAAAGGADAAAPAVEDEPEESEEEIGGGGLFGSDDSDSD